MKLKSSYILPGIIVLLAFVVRWYNADGWSLTNDELSAWLRLKFNSLGEVIEQGVRPDFHPAGVQTFLYVWTSIFGDSPGALRFPFVIIGTLAVWLTYVLGKRWFGTSAGIMAAIGITFFQLPLLYSQIARPYAPGMFFALALAYCWTRVLWDERPRWWWEAGFALFLALNAYNHYFSGLFAVLLGLSGLFFLNKQNWKAYIISAAVGSLLFLPHMGITMDQLSRGGLSSWLGPPEPDFIVQFLLFSVFDIYYYGAIVCGLILLPFLIPAMKGKFSKFHWVSLGLFVISYLIGYFYSTRVNPILQNSILIFSFPFLVLFLFSFWGEGNARVHVIIALAFSGLGLATLAHPDYKNPKFATFKDLVIESERFNTSGEHSSPIPATRFYNAIADEYIKYYYDRLGYNKDYLFHRGDDTAFIAAVQKAVYTSKEDYFIYGWTNNRNPESVYAVIQSRFPGIVKDYPFFNSRLVIFSRKSVCSTEEISLLPPLVELNPNDVYPQEHPDAPLFKVTPAGEYYEYLAGPVESFRKKCDKFLFDLEIDQPATKGEVLLVTEIRRGDSILVWKGAGLHEFSYIDSLGACHLSLMVHLDENVLNTDFIKVYLWNKDKLTLQPKKLSIIGLRPEAIIKD